MKRYDFNTGWTYAAGDGPSAGITLPHDAMLHTKRCPDNPGSAGQAFFSGGTYRYVKQFCPPAEWKGQHVKLQFEAVYKDAIVRLNGREIASHAYGYTPFWADCGILRDGVNIITVTCSNKDQPDSRFYSGAGIYRPVWAWAGDGITEEDIRITTMSLDPAVVRIMIAHSGDGAQDEHVQIADGSNVVAEGDTRDGVWDAAIPDAKLWSADSPHLYTCICGDVSVRFGIRKMQWSPKGLYINGKETLLKGGCLHTDSGLLGTATYAEAEKRRVRILKESGFNAIRSAHNPCSRALLIAADELGMYIMDETWDMWYYSKTPHDYASQWKDHYLEDITAMTDRDYNHPSVIMYSIGNEVAEPADEKGLRYEKEMVQYLHMLDPTRPVTGGFNLMIIANAGKAKGDDALQKMNGLNSTRFNQIAQKVGSGMNRFANGRKADAATAPALDALDIAGYNYASGRYPKEGKCHPERIILGTETFPADIAKNWQMVQKYPYLAGDFMWTAWDYLGEAGLGAWGYTEDSRYFSKPYPWLLADAGAYDILGNPGGEAYLAAAVWHALDKPAICVQPLNHPGTTPYKGAWRGTSSIPSWSWSGCEGNKARIEIFYDCHHVTLSLNGASLGKRRMKGCMAVYNTKYEPGELICVAYDAKGKEVARSSIHTAKADEIQVRILPPAAAKPGEIVYVPICIADGEGTAESSMDRKLAVYADGADLLAYGSANPRTEESFLSGVYTTYYGRSLAILRMPQSGKAVIHVAAGDEGECARAEILVEE
ncbi:MAG: DUF4982 domain-containing protein [Clostridia bacterium]|nr:DUF4982 domain-containing protein [Clostridia bacterium]